MVEGDDGETLVPVVVSGFSNNLKSSSYGLLALRPEDGAEIWRRELQAKPHRHDCNLIDVNQDGVNDCIVVGHEGLLTAIDPKTGKHKKKFDYGLIIFELTRMCRL